MKTYGKIKDFDQPTKGLDGFQRHIYQFISDKSDIKMPVLIHYIGNEKIYKPRAHGNRKVLTNAPIHKKTAPSTLTVIKEQLATKSAVEIYQSSSGSNRPRNLKQVINEMFVTIYQTKIISYKGTKPKIRC